jgi:short-subunit dehydrogenase
MYGLEGRIAIVTGAAAGIGRGVAERLAMEGCRVTLVDREAAALKETSARLNDRYGRIVRGDRAT